ncbi:MULTISPECIES: c-type cytochrome [Leptospira]|uniref:Cytochrome C n=6 Tax=Leptospira santarosai TaxID=28183 RepID=A0AB73LPL5_9LEPT|nr:MULTISPECIES: cytochrome c [Leptospira]ASV12666.1 cytochrome C [Leptospira santarosai]AVV51510.1 Cytochrome C [Leptospira santarosai]AVV79800.1 Cytochrome C [Leptospira santarosai]EKO32881.1 cytochrome C [Leptospira santarosai str. MOR084]EKO79560.1 cytochrome C [Leptospira sp. Fiocruz LV3954]
MNSKNMILSIVIALTSWVLFLNCGDKSEKPTETTPTETASTLSPELQKGQEIFNQNCASCHGEKGAGDGAAAASLNPKPRNYRAPVSQWKNGNTEAGVLKTLNNGIPNSPMVAYKFLGDENLKLLAKYVVHLSQN